MTQFSDSTALITCKDEDGMIFKLATCTETLMNMNKALQQHDECFIWTNIFIPIDPTIAHSL